MLRNLIFFSMLNFAQYSFGFLNNKGICIRTTSYRLFAGKSSSNDNDLSNPDTYKTPTISWYPGN